MGDLCDLNDYRASMADPLPLTQTAAAKLDWSHPEAPTATDFSDIYFSADGGLDETRAVFLNGCGLPDRWAGKNLFTIAELGFGSGLNFLASWQAWALTAKADQRLHYVSIEKFPFDKKQLQRALSAWPELQKFASQLLDNWPGRVKGIHRLNFGSVTLTLIHEDVLEALGQVEGLKAEAWFLDGFSPLENPAMWSPEVMRSLADCSAPGARLATFSVAGTVKRALSEAGFTVRKMPGFGRKRHRLEADYVGRKPTQTAPIEKALIVGAGIAGRSIAHALSARHIPFDIIDDKSHPAASGNSAALVKPRFDLQDRPESRFFLSAYLHALRGYPEEAIISRGIRDIPKTEKDAERYKKLAAQAPLGGGHMRWETDSLWIDEALVIDPSKLFKDFDIRRETYRAVQSHSDYSHVFIAAGYGLRALAPSLGLRFSRGQLSWAQPVWDTPTTYGGYAVNIEGTALVGATHDGLNERDPFEVRPEDDQTNLSAMEEISGRKAIPVDRPSRASVRVTIRDTLPVICDLSQNHWAISGLGSRGFTFAPLLAEALISNLCNEVGALDKKLRAKFSDLSRLP